MHMSDRLHWTVCLYCDGVCVVLYHTGIRVCYTALGLVGCMCCMCDTARGCVCHIFCVCVWFRLHMCGMCVILHWDVLHSLSPFIWGIKHHMGFMCCVLWKVYTAWVYLCYNALRWQGCVHCMCDTMCLMVCCDTHMHTLINIIFHSFMHVICPADVCARVMLLQHASMDYMCYAIPGYMFCTALLALCMGVNKTFPTCLGSTINIHWVKQNATNVQLGLRWKSAVFFLQVCALPGCMAHCPELCTDITKSPFATRDGPVICCLISSPFKERAFARLTSGLKGSGSA